MAAASSAGGCAVSGHFGSLFGRDSDARAEASATDISGSIGSRKTSAKALPSDTDLVFTRMAVVDVLQRGSKEISTPWENPGSGARGTVTPIASAYTRDGETCREFLASYVKSAGPEVWLQGEACRAGKGGWQVKTMRPWTRS